MMDLKITLVLQKGRFFLRLLCKHVLISRQKLERYGRAINSSFFSMVKVTGVSKNFLFNKVLLMFYSFKFY